MTQIGETTIRVIIAATFIGNLMTENEYLTFLVIQITADYRKRMVKNEPTVISVIMHRNVR